LDGADSDYLDPLDRFWDLDRICIAEMGKPGNWLESEYGVFFGFEVESECIFC